MPLSALLHRRALVATVALGLVIVGRPRPVDGAQGASPRPPVVTSPPPAPTAVATAAAPPTPPTAEAQAHHDAGMGHYGARNFAAAIAEFRAALAVEERADTLFALAQAERLSGDCAAAIPHYQRFLELDPTPAQIEATRLVLGRCTEAVARTAEPPPPATAAAPATTAGTPGSRVASPPASRAGIAVPMTASPPPPPVRSPALRDPWFVGLGAGALLSAAGGSALILSAHGVEDDAMEAQTYDDHDARAASADRRFGLGMGALIVAGGLAVATTIRWLAR